jgi:hypothetical protein
MKKGKDNLILIPIILAFVLLLPGICFAQSVPSDVLLKEYILPVRSYQTVQTVAVKKGAECDIWDNAGAFLNAPEDATFPACKDLGTTGGVIKLDNGALQLNSISAVGYKFDVAESANYSFKIQVANNADNLAVLSQADIFYYESCGMQCGWSQSWIGSSEYITEDPTISSDLAYLNKYRKLYFAIYVNGVRTGTMSIPAFDAATKIQDISLNLGALQAGTNNVQIVWLNDTFLNFGNDAFAPCTAPAALGSPFCKAPEGWQAKFDAIKNHLLELDKDKNGSIDANPVIFSASLDKVQSVDDVVGIRIYTNKDNKYPAQWYNDNVINPSSNIENTTIDGYQAVRDGRTVYVSAANVIKSDTTPATYKVYTNMYVIAYNENAAPETANILGQMVENFNFNTNLRILYPSTYELNREQLRRDTIRKADIHYLNQLLANYHQKNGKFPDLTAGTYVPNHSISTWPSWNSGLGNALATGLPVDPLNYMSTTINQLDCVTNPTDCQVVCSRDDKGNPLTGCASGAQCMDNQYCSICPLGYDSKTCWDQTKLKFAYDIHKNCANTSLAGAFNLGGTNCDYNGAYVYQYTALDGGKKYLLNYRLEFQTQETCAPGDCFINDKCFTSGSCIVRGKMCLAGTTINSCGDGFLEADCGEDCDANLGVDNLCNLNFGNHSWYKPVKGICSASCELQNNTTLTKDQCGGYCGDGIVQKDNGETCDSNSAYCINCRCVPNCKGRCGGVDNGCGGKCTGTCGLGQICEAGICITDQCAIQCKGKCGHLPKQPGDIALSCDCGVCADANSECNNSVCVPNVKYSPSCVPNCTKSDGTKKDCGGDGCNGTCGVCGIGKECDLTTDKCSLACNTTCVELNVSKQIYPCGNDGCFNLNGCYANADQTNCQGYINPATTKVLGASWKCNPLLGRCTCELKADDPLACHEKCSGYDGCDKACTFNCASRNGPCNTEGSLSQGNAGKASLADKCLTCSDYCQIWSGTGNYSNCYDYKIIKIPTLIADYPWVVYLPNDIYDSGIRFVDITDRNKYYPYYIDNAQSFSANGLDPVWPQKPGYVKVIVKLPAVDSVYLIYNLNAKAQAVATARGNFSAWTSYLPPVAKTTDANDVFDVYEDFSDFKNSKWQSSSPYDPNVPSPAGSGYLCEAEDANHEGYHSLSRFCTADNHLWLQAHHGDVDSCGNRCGVEDVYYRNMFLGLRTKQNFTDNFLVGTTFSIPSMTHTNRGDFPPEFAVATGVLMTPIGGSYNYHKVLLKDTCASGYDASCEEGFGQTTIGDNENTLQYNTDFRIYQRLNDGVLKFNQDAICDRSDCVQELKNIDTRQDQADNKLYFAVREALSQSYHMNHHWSVYLDDIFIRKYALDPATGKEWKISIEDPTDSSCTVPVNLCGNGKIDGDEICDDGTKNGTFGYCNATCNGIEGLGTPLFYDNFEDSAFTSANWQIGYCPTTAGVCSWIIGLWPTGSGNYSLECIAPTRDSTSLYPFDRWVTQTSVASLKDTNILTMIDLTTVTDKDRLLIARRSGDATTKKESYYALWTNLGTTPANTVLRKMSGGSLTTLASSDNDVLAKKYWLQFQVNDNLDGSVNLKGKWWEVGTVMPTAWNLEYTDTSATKITASGNVGLAGWTTVTSYFDNFQVYSYTP